MQSIFSFLTKNDINQNVLQGSNELQTKSNYKKIVTKEGLSEVTDVLVDSVVDATVGGIGSAMMGGSLTSISAPLRVQPIVVVSSNASNTPFYDDVLKTTQDIFAMFYMQALTVLVTPDSGNTFRALRALNPGSSKFNSSLEGMQTKSTYSVSKLKLEFIKEPTINLEADFSKKDFKSAPIAGSTFTLNVKTKESDFNINLNVSMSPTIINNDVMNNIMVDSSTLVDTLSRYDAWRSGKISFFNLISGLDIIKRKKEIAVKDKSGVYEKLINRKNSKTLSWLYSFVTRGNSSHQDNAVISSAYKAGATTNIFIITDAERQAYEMASKSKISNYSTRELLMEGLHAFMIVVIDRDFNRVTFYYKDIKESQTVSAKYLKSGGGNSDSLTEMFKAFSQGSAPSF